MKKDNKGYIKEKIVCLACGLYYSPSKQASFFEQFGFPPKHANVFCGCVCKQAYDIGEIVSKCSLSSIQIKGVVEWMKTWEQLKDTYIPKRFEEDFGANKDDVKQPIAGQQYQHKNGAIYTVLFLTNTDSTPDRLKLHPIDVVYMGQNGKLWSRPLSDWWRSFSTLRKEEECKLKIGNLMAYMKGIELNSYQKGLAIQEWEKLLEMFNSLNKV